MEGAALGSGGRDIAVSSVLVLKMEIRASKLARTPSYQKKEIGDLCLLMFSFPTFSL